jgi:hypothetical protein
MSGNIPNGAENVQKSPDLGAKIRLRSGRAQDQLFTGVRTLVLRPSEFGDAKTVLATVTPINLILEACC